jgi:2-isopropylmalate synthase
VATYQIIDPTELGLEMTLPLGKHSGRHAFSRACLAAGLSLEEDELVAAFARFKARADQGGAVSIHELLQEVTVS